MVPSRDHAAKNGLITRLNKIFFTNSYLWGRFAKFGWLTKKRVRYLERYILFLYAQCFPILLSIMLSGPPKTTKPYIIIVQVNFRHIYVKYTPIRYINSPTGLHSTIANISSYFYEDPLISSYSQFWYLVEGRHTLVNCKGPSYTTQHNTTQHNTTQHNTSQKRADIYSCLHSDWISDLNTFLIIGFSRMYYNIWNKSPFSLGSLSQI